MVGLTTKTERSSDVRRQTLIKNKKHNKNRKVSRRSRQTLNKKKTEQKQKGLPTLSADLNKILNQRNRHYIA